MNRLLKNLPVVSRSHLYSLQSIRCPPVGMLHRPPRDVAFRKCERESINGLLRGNRDFSLLTLFLFGERETVSCTGPPTYVSCCPLST